jgi:predicted DNA-binding transcriptional regulator AlpA
VNNQNIVFLSLKQVIERVTLSKSTVLAWEACDKFPRSVKLSTTKRVWVESDITAWMLSRIERGSGPHSDSLNEESAHE